MKKAISPIISVILIIVVALALIAILMSWGSNFITRSTSEVDDSLDNTCTGAYISFISCDYNDNKEEISVVLINSGKVNFSPNHNFNVVLRDSENNMDFSNINVLDSNALNIGQTTGFMIEDYNGTKPIRLEIRNTMCPIIPWYTNCS